MKFLLPFCFLLLVACNDDGPQNNPPFEVGENKDTAFVPVQMQNPFAPVDISPMDVAYFPVDFPVQKMAKSLSTPPVMRVLYSRPHRQGRRIFGDLVQYGEPWRLGANEASEIELFQPVTIQEKKLEKGRYTIYCIPYSDHWTIVFNSNVFSWGLKPDRKQDKYQFDVPVELTSSPIEYFTMVFEKLDGQSTNLLMAWDQVLVRLPIKI